MLGVRWYISYRLSLGDLTEMMAERGLVIYPSTIWRWVQRFVPEFEKRWDVLRRPTGSSWRVDEMYVQILESGPISTEPSTSKTERPTSCCGRTAVSPLPKPSSGRPWRRIMGTARGRSRSMDTSRVAARCGVCAAMPPSGVTS